MPRSVLIIEQGFLKPRGSKPVHGVEIFRLNLMRQLLIEGIEVSVVAERSWAKRIENWFTDQRDARSRDRQGASGPPLPEIFAVPPIAGVPGAGLLGTRAASRTSRRWDTVLFGNARLGLVPAMHYAAWKDLGRSYLLFAHRDPGANFLDAVSTLPFDVVANSEWVAAWYRGQVSGRVSVFYGLANAERFFPREAASEESSTKTRIESRSDPLIHFCLLGRLPNISKGQDRAIAALRLLPEPVRQRIRLHLASFATPPDFNDPCIVAHPWMPAESVGDFLRGMDAMLTISTHETFSQAIVQGMLTGLPIIASDLPVYLEKLDPLSVDAETEESSTRPRISQGAELRRGGFIARNTQEISDAIVALAHDPALRHRLGAEGRQIALGRYVWDTKRFIREHLFPES